MPESLSKLTINHDILEQRRLALSWMLCIRCAGTGDDPYDSEEIYPCCSCGGEGIIVLQERPLSTVSISINLN